MNKTVNRRRAASLACAGLLAVLLAACAARPAEQSASSGEKAAPLPALTLTDGLVIGESGRLRLVYDGGQFRVDDLEKDRQWWTAVSEDQYDGNLNELWRTTAASLIIVNYTKSAQSAQIHSTNPALSGAAETYFKLDNGIKILYDFPDIQLRLALELWVDGNQLAARLPAADIEEYGKSALTSVEVMQFLGSAGEEEEGYFVYPDGSGALFEFQALAAKKNVSRQYKWQLYGNETEYMARDPFVMSQSGRFFLPVYGIRSGGAGIAAVIAEGGEDAGLNLYTSAMAIRLNRICAEFVYRRTYDIAISTLREGGAETVSEYTGLEAGALLYDREIRYLFLEGDGDYSEMAGAIREFCLERGMLQNHLADTAMPLGVDFLVGVRSDSLLSEYIRMTTFEQCGDILERLSERGITSMEVTLEGWEKDGYGRWPASYKAASQAGGTGGLKKLAARAAGLGASLYLNVNFLDAYEDVGGFSSRGDLIRNPRNTVIESAGGDRYLLRPATAAARLGKTLASLPDGVAGLSFEGMGSTLYADHTSSGASTRRQTAQTWAGMFTDTVQTLGGAGVYGGSLPLLAAADRLYDIPCEHSGFTIADRSIPFFQMIVHGSATYSAEPANLFHDERAQLLKQIEYGCMPYFKLTAENASRLKNTSYNTLFSSHYEDYIDRAAAAYETFDSLIGDCWTAAMTAHDELETGVYRVRYDNGVTVYFNYTPRSVTADGVTIPSMDAVRAPAGQGGTA